MKKENKRSSRKVVSSTKTFFVAENETAAECIDRMAREGYAPIKRVEKPFFREGEKGPILAGRQCTFEGRFVKDEQ